MPKPILELENQTLDARSNQATCTLTVSAGPRDHFQIETICPRLQKGSRIVETVDTSIANVESRRRKLISHLDRMSEMSQLSNSEAFLKRYSEALGKFMREAFKFPNIFLWYFRIFAEAFSRTGGTDNWASSALKSARFEIFDLKDAQYARARWIENEEGDIAEIFDAKLAQLEKLEEAGRGLQNTGAGEIDAGSALTTTYVLRFDRAWVNRRRYQVAFDVEHREITPEPGHMPESPEAARKRDPDTRVSTVSTTIDVSPRPFMLSIVAVIGALLGAGILLLVGDGGVIRFEDVIKTLNSASLLVSTAIAVIFFNVYENVNIGKEFKMPADWRSALFIGAICGLAQDRIIEALRALIGMDPGEKIDRAAQLASLTI
jgi:multisubunit Na+/H+ antiporter MnhG subunit